MTRRYSGLWFLLQHQRIKKVCNTTKYFTSGMTFTRKMAREQIPFVFAFNFNQWSWWVCCLMSLWHQFSKHLCVKWYLFLPSNFWKHQLYVITRQHPSRMRNACSVAVTGCQYWGQGGRSSSEQVWTGIQWWPPLVSTRGGGRSQFWCPGGGQGVGLRYDVWWEGRADEM